MRFVEHGNRSGGGEGALFQRNNSLLRPQKFPVLLSREIAWKVLNLLAY
jgi:hypothetical protein